MPLSPPQLSEDGSAALLVTSVSASGDAEDELIDATERLREETTPSGGGLEVAVTGPAGFSLDAIDVFEDINGTLLFATAGLVIVLLLVIYRRKVVPGPGIDVLGDHTLLDFWLGHVAFG